MSGPRQVLVSSDGSGHLWNVCFWDPDTGSSVVTYKGECSTRRGLAFIRHDYLIAALANKPVLWVWNLCKKDQVLNKIVCPGKVSVVTSSGDGRYCALAIKEKVYIWQLSSGRVLDVMSKHYQAITCLQYSSDDGILVSAGEDALCILWIVATRPCRQLREYHLHSLPITDAHVSSGRGLHFKICTVSLDHTCKVYDVASDALLHTISYPHTLHSVCVDLAQYRLYTGASNGHIYVHDLYLSVGSGVKELSHAGTTLAGHAECVLCVAASCDGTLLASGSKDRTCRLWAVASGECVRTLPHHGPVVNVLFRMTADTLYSYDYKPQRGLHPIKRLPHQPSAPPSEHIADDSGCRTGFVTLLHEGSDASSQQTKYDNAGASNKQTGTEVVSDETKMLQRCNQQLYQFALDKILSRND